MKVRQVNMVLEVESGSLTFNLSGFDRGSVILRQKRALCHCSYWQVAWAGLVSFLPKGGILGRKCISEFQLSLWLSGECSCLAWLRPMGIEENCFARDELMISSGP